MLNTGTCQQQPTSLVRNSKELLYRGCNEKHQDSTSFCLFPNLCGAILLLVSSTFILNHLPFYYSKGSNLCHKVF